MLFYLILILLIFLGLPLFAALGLFSFYLQDKSSFDSILVLFLDPFNDITRNEILLPIPFFALSGFILARAKTAERLFYLLIFLNPQKKELANFWVGALSLFLLFLFTPMTGASGVTIIALGGLLFPLLAKANYSERQNIGLITAGGSLGLLLFPSLPVILYGILSNNKANIKELFKAGIFPSFLLLFATMLLNKILLKNSQKVSLTEFSISKKEILKTILELAIIPFIFFLFQTGKITPQEMSVIFLGYFMFLEIFLFKEIQVKNFPEILEEAFSLVGGIFLIIFFALSLTKALIFLDIPEKMFSFFSPFIQNKWQFLLILNLFLLLVGMLMDIFSAIVVISPLIIPVAESYGIDMIHLGILFLTNLEIGYLTPPVGVNLFISSFRFGKDLTFVYSAVWPYVLVLLICQIIITYIPALSLWYR